MDTISLTPEERKKHIDMMLSPYKWPQMYLPLKKRGEGGLGWRVALLRSAISKKTYERSIELGVEINFVVDVNMTMFGMAVDGEVERVVFHSPVEILDAGWIVD